MNAFLAWSLIGALSGLSVVFMRELIRAKCDVLYWQKEAGYWKATTRILEANERERKAKRAADSTGLGRPTSADLRAELDYLESIGLDRKSLNVVAALLDRGFRKEIIGYQTKACLASFIMGTALRLGMRRDSEALRIAGETTPMCHVKQ